MSADSRALPFLSPDRQLHQYLRRIREFPLLDPDEELALARRAHEQGDLKATHRLVSSYLRLVPKMARQYRGYGLPLDDLIAEGNLGIVRAVLRFDPHRGFRLATLAIWWIRAAIQEYILHSWSLVRIGATGAQKKLFFNLRRLKAEIEAIEGGKLTLQQVDEIAEKLRVSAEEVISMNGRLAGPDHSLNAPIGSEDDEEWQDWLVDERPNAEARLAEDQELANRRSLLMRALATLGEREQHILTERRLKEEPATLNDLSQYHNISRERVRQIELAAYQKLSKAIHRAPDHRAVQRLERPGAAAQSQLRPDERAAAPRLWHLLPATSPCTDSGNHSSHTLWREIPPDHGRP